MDKTIIIIAIISVVILGGVVWLGQPSGQNGTASLTQSSERNLKARERIFDFGTISMAAGLVSHSFKVKNTGEELVVIERIYASCMCTAASLVIDGKKFGPFGMQGHGFIPRLGKKLEPQKEAEIEVEFDPAAHGPSGVGYIERVVYMETSADLEQFEIAARGNPVIIK